MAAWVRGCLVIRSLSRDSWLRKLVLPGAVFTGRWDSLVPGSQECPEMTPQRAHSSGQCPGTVRGGGCVSLVAPELGSREGGEVGSCRLLQVARGGHVRLRFPRTPRALAETRHCRHSPEHCLPPRVLEKSLVTPGQCDGDRIQWFSWGSLGF